MSSFAATATNPFTGSYDPLTSTVTWTVSLAIAGVLSLTTRSVQVMATASDNRIVQKTFSALEMQQQIAATIAAGLTASSITISASFAVATVDTLFLSVYEEQTSDSNTQIVNSGTGFNGIIQVVGKPDSPVVSIVSKTFVAGSGDNVSLSAMTVKVVFGLSNGGNPLASYNLVMQKRLLSAVSVFNILNQSIAAADLTAGYVEYILNAGNLGNFADMTADTSIVIRASVDNSDRESDLSPIPAIAVASLRLAAPTIVALNNAAIDAAVVSNWQIQASALPAAGKNVILQQKLVGGTWTTVGGACAVTSTMLATGSYTFTVNAATAYGFTSADFRAFSSDTATYAASSPVQSVSSIIVSSVSSIQPIVQTSALVASISALDNVFTQTITGYDPIVAPTTSLFMTTDFYKNAVKVKSDTINAQSGAAPNTVAFNLLRSSGNNSDSYYTVSTIYAMVTVSSAINLVGNNATLIGAPVKIVISQLTSPSIVAIPVNTASTPSIVLNTFEWVNISNKLSFAFNWGLLNNISPFDITSVEMRVLLNGTAQILTSGGLTVKTSTSPENENNTISLYAASAGAGAAGVQAPFQANTLYKISLIVNYVGTGSPATVASEPVFVDVMSPNSSTPDAPTMSVLVFNGSNQMSYTPTQVSNANLTYNGAIYSPVSVTYTLWNDTINAATSYVTTNQIVAGAVASSLAPILYSITATNNKYYVAGIIQYAYQSSSTPQNSSQKSTISSATGYSGNVNCPAIPTFGTIGVSFGTTTFTITAVVNAGNSAANQACAVTALVPYYSAGTTAAYTAPLAWSATLNAFVSAALIYQSDASLYQQPGTIGYIMVLNTAGQAFSQLPQ